MWSDLKGHDVNGWSAVFFHCVKASVDGSGFSTKYGYFCVNSERVKSQHRIDQRGGTTIDQRLSS